MSDDASTTPPAAPAAPPTAPPTAPTAEPADPMVSAALLRESQATASTLQSRLAEVEAALQSTTDELDTARTTSRRLSVRMATGIDDDQIADMAHARWASAMEGAEAQVDVGAWWAATAADEAATASLPRALRVYLPTAAEPAAAQSGRPVGTPGHRQRRTPAPGDGGTLTLDKFARMSADDQRAAAASFWAASRKRTRR